MRQFLRPLLALLDRDRSAIRRINVMRTEFAQWGDDRLRTAAAQANDLLQFMAITATAASRILRQDMFDVQLRGALALTRGSVAEMQTGEGKTLAAVPAIAWFAREHRGVHVMTVNDYLARRDAKWMGDIYRFLGLTCAYVQQGMTTAERRAAYACDITYATPNEIGFDLLRDRLALFPEQQVHRPFGAAVIDEADSILIDEARIPLVVAGGDSDDTALAYVADRVARQFEPHVHFTVDVGEHNVALTDSGIRLAEEALACGNLFDPRNLRLHTALQDALHAHALLHRDVDYLVKNGAIEMVDEFKGRIAINRRWPAGLHTAVEAKEAVAPKSQGMILGTTTLQDLIALYPRICGMTGTAMTQSREFLYIYEMPVEPIPTNRPMIRVDHPDRIFPTKEEKERAVIAEIRRAHATGQPILVGTASVEESERISSMMDGIPHFVLNARNDEAEAAIVAGAGQRGAVTISTNMAGRGTDIRLGDGVADVGGLYVIGTNRHESRRIDNQLRGRSGRQGDPGCSRFFVSLEDPMLVRYGDLKPKYRNNPAAVQSLVEGQHLDQRLFLLSYDSPIEGQRNKIHAHRKEVLEGRGACKSELERLVTLRTIDDLWADYLGQLEDFRAGIPWQAYATSPAFILSLDRRTPLNAFLRQIDEWFPALEASIPEEVARRLAEANPNDLAGLGDRGALWTYLTTDQPFGSWTKRFLTGIGRRLKA
ncbi:MAG TPA: DEAD/DEAH box helicase [Bryobacteraceae bacterium]|nr:DEAD/DEAH box helicase [Bryobacteraceae bacterium]